MPSIKLFTLIFAGLIVSLASADEALEKANPWEQDYRIPKDIIPVSYDMLLDPDLKKGNFKGEITALVNLTASRTWIPIHIKNLDISKTVLADEAGKPVKVVEAFKYLPSQFWIIKTEPVQQGLFKIYLKFNGSLTENISGFYKSVYYENGTSRYDISIFNT